MDRDLVAAFDAAARSVHEALLANHPRAGIYESQMESRRSIADRAVVSVDEGIPTVDAVADDALFHFWRQAPG